MFESDDFDQILSQFDFPVATSTLERPTSNLTETPPSSNKDGWSDCRLNEVKEPKDPVSHQETIKCPDKTNDALNLSSDSNSIFVVPNQSPSPCSYKHTKRKIIDSHFDHKSKRKFPGPAGLLSGSFKENKDEEVCQMELLSQDVDFTQNCLQKDAFDSPLWQRLQIDIKDWNQGSIDTTKAIKQSCISGNLRKRKAQMVAAFVESVDRSITDPLVTIRDSTGSIKCTLHRDAWSKFSPYIVSEYCALVLWKPTILTTGSAFKKYYLNITLSNILAIYSSAVLKDDENTELPEGYNKVHEEDFTVIKTNLLSLGTNNTIDSISEENGLLEELDNIFSDDIF